MLVARAGWIAAVAVCADDLEATGLDQVRDAKARHGERMAAGAGVGKSDPLRRASSVNKLDVR
jgi:hypothetical protein